MVHHQLVKEDGLYVTKVLLPFKNSNKEEKVAFVVDTGAVIALVDTTIIHLLGYSAHEDGIRSSILGGAAGRSVGFMVKLPRFRCLDFKMKDFEIACHDFNTQLGVAEYKLTHDLPKELVDKLPDAKRLEEEVRKELQSEDSKEIDT